MIEWKLRHRNKKQFETIDNIEVINETYNFELDVEVSRVEGNINDLPNFEKRMLLEYIKSGSYRKLSEETNIPYRTIGNHIKRIKDKLK
jgi:DNA-directed RNA polymerase specialized sigma24 family protein